MRYNLIKWASALMPLALFTGMAGSVNCSNGSSIEHSTSGSAAGSGGTLTSNDGGATDAGHDGSADATSDSGEGGPPNGCMADAGPYTTSIPRIDQISYYQELAAQRSDVTSKTTPATGSPCYEGMMIKPEYRAALLISAQLPDAFEKARYTAADKQADETWIADQQQAEVAFCGMHPGGGCHNVCPLVDASACTACPSDQPIGDADAGLYDFYVSGYALCGFVGYKEGPDVQIYDSNGLVWLVYFEFSDVGTDLTPARLQAYAAQLAACGFQGDMKTLTDPRLPQQARYQYNDVIVHGHSEHDGELAEAVGLQVFGPYLSGVGRGLDVQGKGEWAAYLCTLDGDVSALPADAVAYTNYQQ